MKNNFNIYRYITANNPDIARDFLLKNGYTDVPKNYNHVSILLADFVNRNGDEGFKKLLTIHPEVLNEVLKVAVTGIKEKNGEFMNCSGCDFAKMAADATTAAKPQKTGLSEKTTNALIIGGSITLGLLLSTLVIVSVIRN